MPLNGLKMPFSFSKIARCAAILVVTLHLTPFVHAQTSLLIQSSPLAGSQYHALPELVSQIRVGDALTLQREPDNPYDRNAIQVLWQGHMLGFVPRRENKAVARAMDRNEPLIARVVALQADETPWRRLRFEISVPLDTAAPAGVSEKSKTESTH